jgi:hypothetical protein
VDIPCFMKTSLIIPLFLFMACRPSIDSSKAFLDEGIKNCNSQIEMMNERFYTNAEILVCQDPLKNKHKTNVDKIHEKSVNIFNAIGLRQTEINHTHTLETRKIDLFGTIKGFSELMDSLFKKDSIMQNQMAGLEIDKSELENYNIGELNILANKIQIISLIALTHFNRKMEYPRYRANKIEVAVLPENRYLHYKDIYKADLFLLNYDTAANIGVQMEGKNLEVLNGKAIYTDTCTNKAGIITKQCMVKLFNFFREYSYDFPFTLNYQIKNK